MIISEHPLDDDLLLLSGIQHMAFCKRQWALIHIEQAWAESVRTVEGHHLHERVDDPNQDETRGDLLIIRAMPVFSKMLGLRGVADVVEFRRTPSKDRYTCRIPEREGFWVLYPIEYKRGRPKPDDRDAVQLCAQAIALEEMLSVEISEGAIFYWQTRRREVIEFNEAIRRHTKELSEEMHRMMKQTETPQAKYSKKCSLCSLNEICQPKLSKRKSASIYIKGVLREGG